MGTGHHMLGPLSYTAESPTPTIRLRGGQGTPPLFPLAGLRLHVQAQWQTVAGASVWQTYPQTVAMPPSVPTPTQ